MFARLLVFATFSSFYVTSSSGNKTDPYFISDYDDISGVSCKYNRECYNADSLCIRGKCRKVFEANSHNNRQYKCLDIVNPLEYIRIKFSICVSQFMSKIENSLSIFITFLLRKIHSMYLNQLNVITYYLILLIQLQSWYVI